LEREDANPCNTCRSCLEITGGSSVDVQEIDGASNRGIDEIRELRENIKYMPSSSGFRVYIIDEVHMLTIQAFNALLKTLEEPPPHVKFIFATTEPHKVPVTILSRCQRFDFKRIPMSLIVKQLEKITGEEGIDISRPGLSIIAREAEGSMRDAESLLDQVASFAGAEIEIKNITDILGIIDRELIFETSQAIIEGSSKRCMEIADRVYNYGYDIKEFYRALMEQFRNLAISLITSNDDLFDMTDDDREEIKRQAEKAGLEKLQQSLSILIAREEDLRFTSHPRLILETIMIKLCHLGEVLSFDELIGKIEALEKRILASSTSNEKQPVGHISDPAKGWEKEEREEEVEPPSRRSAEPSDEQDWVNLLNYLASKNKAMANVLKEWHVHSLTDDTLELATVNSSFSSSYFDDPERLHMLTDYCREFFKRDVKVTIAGNRKMDDKEIDSAGPSPDPPQSIQEILQVFNGEIKEEVEVENAGTKNPK
jgi:DNA polymerase-3 subunit gamma/tau